MVKKYSTDEERKEAHKQARLRWYNKPETKEKLAVYAKERRSLNPELRMFDCARYRAKTKGIEFDITVADIIIPEICPILLIPLVRNPVKLGPNSPTVDRIDTTKGYIKGNVRVISHRANSCKSDMTFEDIKRLYEYIQNKL